jgi:hypothetical protein
MAPSPVLEDRVEMEQEENAWREESRDSLATLELKQDDVVPRQEKQDCLEPQDENHPDDIVIHALPTFGGNLT